MFGGISDGTVIALKIGSCHVDVAQSTTLKAPMARRECLP
jgi:hypothetical protein